MTTTFTEALSGWIARTRRNHERARTVRIISALNPELRKDIGWPGDSYAGRGDHDA